MKTFIAQWKVDIVANNMFKSEQQQKPFEDFKDAYIRGFKMGVDRTREVRDNTVKKIKNLEEENKTLYAQIDKLIEEIWELKAGNDSLSELT